MTGPRFHPAGAILRAAGIVLAAGLLGTASNLAHPKHIPWVEDWSRYIEAKALKEKIPLVTPAQAVRIVEAGSHLVLDARPEADYAAGHVPGAISMPYDAVDARMVEIQALLTPGRPMLTYCSGAHCDESFLLTLYLRRQGFTNVVLFAAGFDEWKAAGHPLEGGLP